MQTEGTLLVEAEWVDAVDDDLAVQFLDQSVEQRRVAVPRDSHDDDIARPGTVLVRRALDTEADLLGDPLRVHRRVSR